MNFEWIKSDITAAWLWTAWQSGHRGSTILHQPGPGVGLPPSELGLTPGLFLYNLERKYYTGYEMCKNEERKSYAKLRKRISPQTFKPTWWRNSFLAFLRGNRKVYIYRSPLIVSLQVVYMWQLNLIYASIVYCTFNKITKICRLCSYIFAGYIHVFVEIFCALTPYLFPAD